MLQPGEMKLNFGLLDSFLSRRPRVNLGVQIVLRKLPLVLVLFLIVTSIVDDISRLDFDPIGGDATQNFYSAMNLSHHGIYSEQFPSVDVQPGFRREPVPNFILAGYLKVLSVLMPSFVVDGFLDVPELLYAIKTINLFYAVVIMLGMWLLLRSILAPPVIADVTALPSVWCCQKYFIADEMNGLNTEMAVASFLLLLTYFLVKAYQTRLLFWVVVAGLGIGLLAMTKAIGAYLALLIIPLFAVIIAQKRRHFLTILMALTLGFLLTVAPWVLRNQFVFGKPVIAQGGGDVLLIRAVFNTMTPLEYKGAFYAYSPDNLQELFSSHWLPFAPRDLECGGSLERLNRKLPCDRVAFQEKRYDDVRSLYRRGKHALPRLLGLSREERQSEGVRRIQSMPWSHLRVSIPLGWRGFWAFTDSDWISVVINASAFGSLLLAPLFAFAQRRVIWLIVSIVPWSYFLFYMSLTHFLPRYSEPLIPLALVVLGMLVIDSIASLLPGRYFHLR